MSKIYISARANRAFIEYLAAAGHTVCMLPPLPQLEHAIADHPDLVFCSLNPASGGPVFHGKISALKSGYPSDVPYNACCTGRYFIHNLKYTAPELLDTAKSMGMTLVDVPQGYTRCSCLPVDETSIITSDRGIIGPCRKAGLDVLEVSPGHVLLPGYRNGFIGGTAGRISGAGQTGDAGRISDAGQTGDAGRISDAGQTGTAGRISGAGAGSIIFHGNLAGHPDGAAIRRFIEDRGLDCVDSSQIAEITGCRDFAEFPLTDIGSIIEEPEGGCLQ